MKFKRCIKKIVYKMIYSLPVKNYILFESVPDLSDNTRAVFDEMVKREINRHYKFIWLVTNDSISYPKIENVKYIRINSKLKTLALHR